MKKAKGNSSASENKDDARAVDKYITDLPEPARSTLKKIRAMLRSASPAETTEGFSYGIPAFKVQRTILLLRGVLKSLQSVSDEWTRH